MDVIFLSDLDRSTSVFNQQKALQVAHKLVGAFLQLRFYLLKTLVCVKLTQNQPAMDLFDDQVSLNPLQAE